MSKTKQRKIARKQERERLLKEGEEDGFRVVPHRYISHGYIKAYKQGYARGFKKRQSEWKQDVIGYEDL